MFFIDAYKKSVPPASENFSPEKPVRHFFAASKIQLFEEKTPQEAYLFFVTICFQTPVYQDIPEEYSFGTVLHHSGCTGQTRLHQIKYTKHEKVNHYSCSRFHIRSLQ
jgi:hypothetical protein